MSEELADRYEALARVVRRAGGAHAAGFEPLDRLDVVVEDDPATPDGELRAAGEAHLRALRAAHPAMYDGPVLALGLLDSGVLRLRPSGFFDHVATGDALRTDPALRERAELLAAGDPLRRGDGRAAGVGVTVIATLRDADGGRALVLGRRVASLPLSGGQWHVAPSGMLERSADPLRDTARMELREELGLDAPAEAFGLLGMAWDLGRLMADVVLRADLDVDARAVLAAPPTEEYAELRAWPLHDLGALWAAHPPGTLTPPAAAAVALLEASLEDG